MGLSRLILFAIIIGGGIWLWRRFNKRVKQPHQPITHTMVRCAHCHVHLPQDRAIQAGPYWYCSNTHRQQGPHARD